MYAVVWSTRSTHLREGVVLIRQKVYLRQAFLELVSVICMFVNISSTLFSAQLYFQNVDIWKFVERMSSKYTSENQCNDIVYKIRIMVICNRQ